MLIYKVWNRDFFRNASNYILQTFFRFPSTTFLAKQLSNFLLNCYLEWHSDRVCTHLPLNVGEEWDKELRLCAFIHALIWWGTVRCKLFWQWERYSLYNTCFYRMSHSISVHICLFLPSISLSKCLHEWRCFDLLDLGSLPRKSRYKRVGCLKGTYKRLWCFFHYMVLFFLLQRFSWGSEQLKWHWMWYWAALVHQLVRVFSLQEHCPTQTNLTLSNTIIIAICSMQFTLCVWAIMDH